MFGFFGSCMNREKEVEKENERAAKREGKGVHLGMERRGRAGGSSDHSPLLGSIFCDFKMSWHWWLLFLFCLFFIAYKTLPSLLLWQA